MLGAISGTQTSLEMATGSGRLPTGRSGVDFTVQLDVPLNAPEAFPEVPVAELDTSSPECLTKGLFKPKTHVFSVAFCPYSSHLSRKTLDAA